MIENESMWTPDGQLKENTQAQASLFPVTTMEEPEEPEVQPAPTEVAVQAKKGDYDENIANLRKKAEDLEYRLRKSEEEREQERARLAQQYQPQYQQPVYNQPADDDLIEGRHLAQLQKKISELEANLQQTAYQNQALAIENKLKAKHADFDKVVNEENLRKLRDQEPEVFKTIIESRDMYAQGVTAYSMLKKFGIVPDDDTSLSRIIANSGKPRYSNSVAPQQSNSPLTKANPFTEGLTPEARKALLKEMDDAISRL